jgi:hypothetical protein
VPEKHYLPSKVLTYLRRLELEYERIDNPFLLKIARTCRVYVREATEYDNWNGGTYYGHDAILFLPEDVIKYIPLATQDTVQEEIKTALNECASGVSNEFFRAVQLEMADESDPEFQRANSLSSRPQTDPNALAIWQPGHLRLFITHRDGHKRQAHELATALEEYGVSAFVAHDTIGALEDWQSESRTDFEHHVKAKLEKLGWSVRRSGRSGDQGADLIAQKDDCTVAVQCKFYSGAVGNKAVQEAHAGKGYHGTDSAAVVSTGAFTPAARQLARSLGVTLLDVANLDGLGQRRAGFRIFHQMVMQTDDPAGLGKLARGRDQVPCLRS